MALASLASRQHGRVATWQIDLTASQLRRRVERGSLHREWPGVYAVGHPGTSPEARRMAAVLGCGPRALLCHRSLAHQLGLLDGDGPARVDVAVPGCRRRARAGLRLHQPRELRRSEATVMRGIPCTTVERLLADLAVDASDAELATVVHRAQVRRLLRPSVLERQLARSSAGIERLRQLVEPTGADLRGALEEAFAAFVRRGGWPPYETNVLLDTPLGRLRADALWRKEGFVVELDSWAHHGGRDAFESDRERDVAADLVGLSVGRVTWRMLRGRPHVVRAMLDHRVGR